jgi:hypothetical protein
VLGGCSSGRQTSRTGTDNGDVDALHQSCRRVRTVMPSLAGTR